MEAKRKELQEQQEALEKSMAQGYQDERQKLINEAKEAKRMEMLGRLRDQAKKEDQVSIQNHFPILLSIDSYNIELFCDQRLAALKKAREAEAAATVDKSDDVRQSHSEGMMMSLDKKVLSQMQEPLPDIAKSSQAQEGRYAKVGPNPLDDLDDIPIGSKA